ncbi:MAG: FtsX-like permease family protein [Pseudomonadota bacterium]
MFRNYLAAALRNLQRNQLHALINITGLAVGFAAAIFALLFVRDELGYDRWIPGHEQSYRVSPLITPPDRAPLRSEPGPGPLAAWLKNDFPQVEGTARLTHPWTVAVKYRLVEANEKIYWADPNFLDIVRLPVVAGDPHQALQQPDGLVLTQRLARKYFGRDTPIGQTLEIRTTLGGVATMRVLAVLQDLPSDTHLDTELLGSGRAPYSGLTDLDANPDPDTSISFRAHTYLRLAKGASAAELQAAMPAFLKRHRPNNPGVAAGFVTLEVLPIAAIHFAPSAEFIMKPRGNIAAVYAILLVGGLIVLIAMINFVNLTTARAVRRSVEVGVRKAAGASQSTLIVQFIGESLIYCVLGAVLAIALTELLLPYFNSFLQRTIDFDYWRDPLLALGLAALVLLAAIGGGAYPAIVLAAFAPGRVLKQSRVQGSDRGGARKALVVAQFAILIGLIVCAGVVYRQTTFSMTEGLRLDKDQVLLIDAACQESFRNRVAALSGVRFTACSSRESLDMDIYTGNVTIAGRPPVNMRGLRVDFDFFETYGLKPLAGRTFSREFGADRMPDDSTKLFGANLIINEAAARSLGFGAPQEAIGQIVRTTSIRGPDNPPSEIIGVVPDYHLAANREAVTPAMFFVDYRFARALALSVKLEGDRIPETVQAIDAAWRDAVADRPISRRFIDQYVQELYVAQQRQSGLLTILSVIAVAIAALGLFGLTVFATERRTKEIGVRKALGASSSNIVQLLLWQFTQPVLWATLLAWPAAGWIMHRWLRGFAYHIDLSPEVFAIASLISIVIALLTVSVHSIRVARARPVLSLRDE